MLAYVSLHEVAWLYGVHRLAPRRQQFHVEPAMPEHITLVDIKNIKTRYKKLVTCVESRVSAVSA